jgi:aspartate/methionine/tyrosine aminotransferase
LVWIVGERDGCGQRQRGVLVENDDEHLVIDVARSHELDGRVQRALPALLRSRHTAADAIRDRVRRNCGALGQALEGSALSLLVPEGGWSAVLRLPRTRTDEDWTLALLERGVVVQPGFFFDLEDGPYLVLSLITPPAKLDQGIGEIVLAVREG